MPNILFASNSVSHFPGSVIGPAPWSYDSNRVPYSIMCPLETPVGSPDLPDSATDEWWFHFRCGSDLWYVNNNEPIFEIADLNGDRIFLLSFQDRTTEGFHSYFVVDGTQYMQVRYLPMANNQARTYDIQLKYTALNAELRVYMNEILIESFTYPVTSWIRPGRIFLGGSQGSGGDGQTYYSEIIVADGDTRNARLDLLRPAAVGAYGNWNGPVASLSDDDPTTGMTTVSPDQYQSTILTPYTGANNVSNVVQITTSVRGINSPTKLQHLIRMSAVDYLTPSFDVPFSKDYQITDWAENPATSLPWAAADLAAAEFGFKSIA